MLADVIAYMAAGMPTMGVDGRCYSQGGRWNSHWVNVLVLILMFCVGPHPIYEVDAYVSI